jgi:alpha-tubulin suppressor-like RCC1 family protein
MVGMLVAEVVLAAGCGGNKPSAPPLTGAVSVTMGDSHACAVMDDGTARCWGLDAFGQIGDGGKGYIVSKPSTVAGISGVRSVAVGHEYSCALGADGGVSCWGDNLSGQIGNGCGPCGLPGSAAEQEMVLAPLAVTGLSGPATALVANTSYGDDLGYNCAVLQSGGIECWGADSLGLSGQSNALGIPPTAVPGVTNAVAVSAAIWSACALLADGTVACWGLGPLGQPGKSPYSDSATAIPVPGISGAIAMTTGDFHGCAVLADGTVSCWGGNTSGSLGNGTMTDSPTAVPVSDLSGAIAIGAAGFQTCALLGDGTVRCWGNDTAHLTPVAVPGLTGALSISVAKDGACARVANGQIECWGDNSYGQLGDGNIPDDGKSSARITTPQQVIAGD